MKKYVWLKGGILLCIPIMMSAAFLAGCGSEEKEETEKQQTQQVQQTQKEDYSEETRSAYMQALQNIVDHHVWPDGTSIDASYTDFTGDEGLTGNKWAIMDIDHDGSQELLLSVENTSMAFMFLEVYGYNPETESLFSEMHEFPTVDFYDNGTAVANWSHNQGRGMELWPYNLYTYDSDSDTYVYQGSVDSWDQSYVPDGFPVQEDQDGDGTVYYLSKDITGMTDSTPVDGDVYHEWADPYFAGASEVEVAWQKLSEISFAADNK